VPGLCGVVTTRGDQEAARRFRAASQRMLRHGRMKVDAVSALEGTCVIGHVHLNDADVTKRADLPVVAVDDGIVVTVHGVLHNERALRKHVEAAQREGTLEDAIAALYRKWGAEFAKYLEGEFVVSVVDVARHRILVATDTIGNYPIYWRADADGFIFTSDLSALLRATNTAARLDLRAVADYLTIGAVLGDKTLAKDVRALDPGTVLSYDVRRGDVWIHPYVRVEHFFQEKAADKAAYLDALESAFAQTVARAATATSQVGLSLSGGLDSRAILSAVPRTTRAKTYTLGVAGCADQAIAARLAAIAGPDHAFFCLDSTYLRDFLPNMAQMVSITDGMYLSHGLTEMLAIRFLDRTGIRVLLRGHGGELAKAHLAWPLHTDQRVKELKSLDDLVPYLSARANYVTPGLPLDRVLTADAAKAAGDGTRSTFAAALANTDLSPSEACSYLYLRELNRRFTVPSLELFRTRVEVRLPYLDPTFLRVLLSAPPEWRDTTAIHQRLIAANEPKLLKVRNSNTGASADAGPLAEFLFDKCNTILKRLNVRGYRHYHNFDGWMRSMLLQTVDSELLAPTARVRSFVSRGVLSDLIRESREGAANRSYLLQILLILELWQRENGVEDAA